MGERQIFAPSWHLQQGAACLRPAAGRRLVVAASHSSTPVLEVLTMYGKMDMLLLFS